MEPAKPRHPLYDFLYWDEEKVRSLYAQIFKGLTKFTEKFTRTVDAEDSKVNLTSEFATGAATENKAVEESLKDVQEPHILYPLNVLSYLLDYYNLKKEVSNANVGNMILIEGMLSILDMKFLKETLELFPIGWQPSRSKKGTSDTELGLNILNELELKILNRVLSVFPPVVQFTLKANGNTLWGILKDEFLREKPNAICFRHGAIVDGDWYLLCVIDNLPGTKDDTPSFTSGDFPSMMNFLVSITKNALGKPKGYYGVSPIMLFRKL